MRRTVTIFTLALLAAAALSTAALAKEGGVELSSVPTGINPGEPWTTDLVLVDGTHGPAGRLSGHAGQGGRDLRRRRGVPRGGHLGLLRLRRRHRAHVRIPSGRDHRPLRAQEAAGHDDEGSQFRGGRLPRLAARGWAGRGRARCRGSGVRHPAPAASTLALAKQAASGTRGRRKPPSLVKWRLREPAGLVTSGFPPIP
jgi:hypothetical protein